MLGERPDCLATGTTLVCVGLDNFWARCNTIDVTIEPTAMATPKNRNAVATPYHSVAALIKNENSINAMPMRKKSNKDSRNVFNTVLLDADLVSLFSGTRRDSAGQVA